GIHRFGHPEPFGVRRDVSSTGSAVGPVFVKSKGFFFPLRGVLLLSFLVFLGLYGFDLLLTRKRAYREKKAPAAERSFKTPVYLGEVCRVEIGVNNPFARTLRVRVQDEPPDDLPAAGRKDGGAGAGKRLGYAR